jgi:methylenetetrahydrofolate reductase (NADPH)
MNQCSAGLAAQEAPAGLVDVIRRLMHTASLEVVPGDQNSVETLARLMPPQTRVYITSPAGRPIAASIEAAKDLRRAGLIPVPHIAARRISDRAELLRTLERLRIFEVDEALVIAGDLPEPTGGFCSALELLQTGAFDKFGFRRLAVAGYPEGHPRIPQEQLSKALAYKSAFARNAHAQTYIVTQFCFDARAIIDWERRIRPLSGTKLPIHVGLPGVTSVKKLLRFATICGVGASARFLRSNVLGIGRLAAAWRPNQLVVDVSAAVAADPGSAVAQFHFFPFGGLEATAQWLRSARSGVLPPE